MGSLWILEIIEVDSVPIFGLDPNQLVFIEFDEGGQLAGESFCNRYDAWYDLSGYNTIKIGLLATTIMGCMPPNFIQDEQAYYQALVLVESYRIHGNTLELYNEDKLVLSYRLN